ncbi:MAG: SDR family oxidoreductase [Acidobacteria bacterium]|nr:SDR family oxidoreductase [Acidobacteriota bacterium]
MERLSNKVAVVTGGSSGIGLAAAKAFAAEGAAVLLVGRRAEAVDAAVRTIPGAHGLVADVADVDAHDRVRDVVREKFGGADIYFANAGVIRITPSDQVAAEEYDQQFAINTRGVFFGVQKIVPVLRPGASIILTSSIASQKTVVGHAVYAGAKAAIEAFARVWAIELKDRGIRVNVLSPGPVETPILSKLGLSPESASALEAEMVRISPLGRLGRAVELADAALFLASDASSFITGVNLPVDGGIRLA